MLCLCFEVECTNLKNCLEDSYIVTFFNKEYQYYVHANRLIIFSINTNLIILFKLKCVLKNYIKHRNMPAKF